MARRESSSMTSGNGENEVKPLLLASSWRGTFACTVAGNEWRTASKATKHREPSLGKLGTILGVAVSFAAPACAASAAILPIDLAAKVFGARPSAMAPDLSPDGDKIVYVEGARGPANVVRVLDLKTKQTTNLIASAGTPDSIDWCEFASEDWVVCHYRGDVPFDNSIVGASHLVAVNLTTKQTKNLGAETNLQEAATIRQDDGDVISYPADASASVIMARNYVLRKDQLDSMSGRNAPPIAIGVDKIALDTMKVTRIEAPNPLAESLFAEPNGTPRIISAAGYDNSGHLNGIIDYRFRARGSTNWLPLSKYDSRAETGAYPVGIDARNNQVYLMQKKDGRDALYRKTLEPDAPIVEVASNPTYDIRGVFKLRHDGPVAGYVYAADRPQIVYFEPSYSKLRDDLGKVLTDDSTVDLAGLSRDGNKVLVFAGSEQDPGAYYVFNRQTRALNFAMEDREALANVPLAPVRRVDVPTSDGHVIPAYLTLPQGHQANGPAVVLPHGGPSARDVLGFDWLAQFLASRGYAVIQPNYRGSAGYGDQFLGDNAFKNWRTAIGDIGASADYLVKQGIADPSRLAILGWSYGGYAALQSAVTTPSKYKAVIAIAPVTDLSRLGRDEREFVNANLATDFIGKGQNLRDGSPLQHAELIKAPVLLVHGDLDANVRVWHSQHMEKALRAAGDQVELLEFKGLNHQLEDGDARTQMLTKIGQLLDKTIGH
jgi:dipeptidyl aminopeptidase/acylaminoacyl peptidase